jgi:predicted secreted protein
MGSDWKDTEATQKSWSASVVAFWDKADVGQLALDVGDTVAISLFPASGSHLTGNALVTSSQISSTVDGIIDYTLELMGKGALTKTGM